MSRKRRRRPSVKPVEPVVATDETAKDGYVNSLAYLGEASPLSQANDYERHSISNDFNLLTILYRENWLAARIIDTPCEDMTRSWYSVSSELEQDKLDELQKLESKHSVKQEITNAIRWGRLYGGAAAVMVIKGQEDMLEEPLDYDMLQPGCFRGLIVIDRVRGIFPSIELEEDMDDPEFGYPKWYQVTLNEESGEIIRIHHSRLLLFRGRQLPIDEEIEADYWGASEIEHVYEELQKRNSSSANIAQLIFQANVAAIKISDYGEVLGMGTAAQRKQVYNYIQEMNRLRTSFGITLMGNEDNYEQHPYSFAGVAEVYETFMMDMAGASEIPATKLFGRAPQGMNATGESDMKNYYEVVSQLQERILRPALEKLLPVMCMSLWGVIPEDLEVVFEPLGTTTPSERAEIMGQAANPIIQAFSAGLISQKTALMELKEAGKPINAWTNISDEDIENAEDQVDQGEAMQDPMGMMGAQGMDPNAMQGMPTEGAPQEMEPQAELDMDKVHELKERIHSMREPQAELEYDPERIEKLKSRLRSLQESQAELETDEETQVELEKVHELKSRLRQIRKTQAKLESEKGKNQVQLERIHKLQAKLAKLRGAEDDGEEPVEGEAESAEFEQEHPRGPGGQFAPKSGGNVATVNYQPKQSTSHQQAAQRAYNNVAGKGEVVRRKETPYKVDPRLGYKSAVNQLVGRSVGTKNAGKTQVPVAFKSSPETVRSANTRNIKKLRQSVISAAQRGDFAAAKNAIIQAKQPKRSLFKDALTFLKGMFDGGPGSGNHGHAGRIGKRGGSAPAEPIDNGPQEAYNGRATRGWAKLGATMKVPGPKGARGFIKDYFARNPDVAKEVPKYMGVRKQIADFLKDHPEAENFNTYDAETGKVKPISKGFCVTFHQNNTPDDPLGGYSDEDYAGLCAIAVHELGAPGVNIGYYGNPEVSFECQSEEAAKRFAVEHNQQSIYNASTGRTLKNKQYRPEHNPIRL